MELDEYDILKNIYEKHGYFVSHTEETKALIRYVYHIGYNQGYKDKKQCNAGNVAEN